MCARRLVLTATLAVAATLGTSASAGAADDLAFGLASPSIEQLRAAESRLGFRAGIVSLYSDFVQPFPSSDVAAVHAGGAAALISWEPWDWAADGALEQPAFALARVAAGAHDDAIVSWLTAAGAAAGQGRVIVRFAPEMNGGWRPWSPGVNGTTPADVVAAWRHVHDIAQRVGASEVEWMWNPNVITPGSTPLWRLYPGGDVVDLVGLDGFNWGTTRSWSHWESFRTLFEPTVRRIRVLAPDKPWGVAETASASLGGNKRAWTRHAFAQAHRLGAQFLVWFDFDKETDWRLTHDERLLRIARNAMRS